MNGVAEFNNCKLCIVVQLPPRGKPIPNDRLYRIAVIGGGFHGLLASPTTHIPGLVSIVDIAPTDLGGHPATSLSWKPSRPTAALGQLSRVDHAIGANNRLKFAALFILAGVLLALALLGLRAAMTAVPAALLVNLALGIGQVSNEVLLCAAISAGTALVALALARLCRSESALLALYGGVVALYAVVMVTRPEWQAVNPFGPTQNSRFWGIGNQVETLLLAPLLAGAFLARRRFGILGFALFGVFGLFVMTDNRLGADGGGAIALGVALAVLGTRLFKLGTRGFIGLLGSAAFAVLWIVTRGLAEPGPNHLRSAFSDHGAGLLSSLKSRRPLSYLPALHAWQLVVPLLFVLAGAFGLAWRFAGQRSTRISFSPSGRDRDVAPRQRLRCLRADGGDRSRRCLRPLRAGSRTRACTRSRARNRSFPGAHEAQARAGAGAGAGAGAERVAARLNRPAPLVPSAAVPIYEYRCPNGHHFERFQPMTAPAPEECDECGASPVELVLYPVAIHYKGSGFYTTDYGKGKPAKKDGDGQLVRRGERQDGLQAAGREEGRRRRRLVPDSTSFLHVVR